MNHNVNQVKVLFEDVRDMYDEDTYQAISVLIDTLCLLKIIKGGLCSIGDLV